MVLWDVEVSTAICMKNYTAKLFLGKPYGLAATSLYDNGQSVFKLILPSNKQSKMYEATPKKHIL